MATDFIKIDRVKGDIYASDLYSLTSLVRQTIDIGEKVKDYFDHNAEGGNLPTWKRCSACPSGMGKWSTTWWRGHWGR